MILLFLKSYNKGYTYTKNGKTVHVEPFSDKRVKRVRVVSHGDDRTMDMFGEDPAEELREIWEKKGVPKEKQDQLIAAISDKAKPGASVGPFVVGSGGRDGKRNAENKKDTITEPRKDLIKEHKRLVNVLESPSHKDDKEEAKRQAKELGEYEEKPSNPPKVVRVKEGGSASKRPDGVYESLKDFEKDTQPFGAVAGLFASMSGMKEDWRAHGKTLGQIIDSVKDVTNRDWQHKQEEGNPAFAHAYRSSYIDAYHVANDVRRLAEQNGGEAVLNKIRGPFALDLINRIASGDNGINIKNYIDDSKPYAKIKGGAPRPKKDPARKPPKIDAEKRGQKWVVGFFDLPFSPTNRSEEAARIVDKVEVRKDDRGQWVASPMDEGYDNGNKAVIAATDSRQKTVVAAKAWVKKRWDHRMDLYESRDRSSEYDTDK